MDKVIIVIEAILGFVVISTILRYNEGAVSIEKGFFSNYGKAAKGLQNF